MSTLYEGAQGPTEGRDTYGVVQVEVSVLRHGVSPSQRAESLTRFGTSAWRSGGASVNNPERQEARARWRARLSTGRHDWRSRTYYLAGGRRGKGGSATASPLLLKLGRAARGQARVGRAAPSRGAQRECRAANGAACQTRWPCCRGVVETAWLLFGAAVAIHWNWDADAGGDTLG
jgi:hypothetical protein